MYLFEEKVDISQTHAKKYGNELYVSRTKMGLKYSSIPTPHCLHDYSVFAAAYLHNQMGKNKVVGSDLSESLTNGY